MNRNFLQPLFWAAVFAILFNPIQEKVSQFGDMRERLLIRKFSEVSRVTVKETLVVEAVQGGIGGFAFWIRASLYVRARVYTG